MVSPFLLSHRALDGRIAQMQAAAFRRRNFFLCTGHSWQRGFFRRGKLSTRVPKRMKTSKLAKSYRIDDGKHFRLKDFDPADTGHLHSVDDAKEHLQKGIARMGELQDKLYAQNCWSVLLIF